MEKQCKKTIFIKTYNENQINLQKQCLETIKTYFRLLEVNLVWDNYLEYVDTHRTTRSRNDHYF